MAKKIVDPIEIVTTFVNLTLEDNEPVYIGIDPGAHGAIGMIYRNRPAVIDIPTYEVLRSTGKESKVKTAFDYQAIIAIFSALRPIRDKTVVILEQGLIRAGGDSGDESSSGGRGGAYTAFRTGCAYAMWPLFLLSKRYSLIEVHPSSWKTRMGLPSTRGGDRKFKAAAKNKSREIALKLFPGADITRVKDHDRAEALLLAEFGRREREGWSTAINKRSRSSCPRSKPKPRRTS